MGVKETGETTGTPGTNSSADHSTPLQQPQPQPQPHQQQQHHHYGTFQGVAYYSQQSSAYPVVGLPQPAPPPPSATAPPHPYYYAHGYHSVPGYVIAEGRPLREPRLACCGIGIGWLLFIAGFFFAAIPWYVGALILLCARVDYREKPGLVACMIASILAVIAIVFGVTGGTESW